MVLKGINAPLPLSHAHIPKNGKEEKWKSKKKKTKAEIRKIYSGETAAAAAGEEIWPEGHVGKNLESDVKAR